MRNTRRFLHLVAFGLLAASVGCATGEAETGGGDAGTAGQDGGGLDATVPDGGSVDSGADGTPSPDATVPDADAPETGGVEVGPHEGGRIGDSAAPDAQPDSALGDAGSDSSQDAPAGDSGVDASLDGGDAGHDAGYDAGRDSGFDSGYDSGFDGGYDAGFDAGYDSGFDAGYDSGADAAVCVSVTTPSSDAGTNTNSCSFTGACKPAMSSYSPIPQVGVTTGAVCTATQIQAFFNNCITGSTISGCTTYMTGSGTADETCGACLLSNRATSSTYGPTIYQEVVTSKTSEYYFSANIGGCISLLEPCNAGCAAILDQQDDCTAQACNTASCTNDTVAADYTTCQNDALACACYNYAQAGLTCQNEFNASPHPAANCFKMWNDVTTFTTVAEKFCWNGQ